MTVRIAHLFPVSPFLQFTAETFEAVAPNANTFLVYGQPSSLHDRGFPDSATMVEVTADVEGLSRVASHLADSDIVIAHAMSPFAARAILAAPQRTQKVWSGWGGDYYGSDGSPVSGLLGPQTQRFRRSQASLPDRVVQSVKRRITSRVLHAVARVTDVFSAPIPSDFEVFARRFPEFRGHYAQLNYASVEDTFTTGATRIAGEDILVGNSASLPNNHFEVLEILAARDLASRRVIVPLSYGDRDYADAVVARGVELLGENFVPLREFLPIDQYQEVISRCTTVVMGHRRQQAIGNIAGALWSGAQVYLDERNPMMRFLRDRGGHIGSLADVGSSDLSHGRVSGEQLTAHRSLLQGFWGRSVVLENIANLISDAAARR